VLLAACAIVATALPALGQKPTFSELLARAQAQAAAGHRWTPAGDNMTETVVSMMDLIPTATADELTKLSELLEVDKEHPQSRPTGAGSSTEERKAAASPVPFPSVDPRATPSTEDSVPARPVRPDPAGAVALRSAPLAPDIAAAAALRPAPSAANGTSAATDLTPAAPAPPAANLAPAAPAPPAANLTPAAPAPPAANLAAIDPVRPAPAAADPSALLLIRPTPKVTQVAPRPGPRAIELFTRGQQAELRGDVSGARRFYSSAAQQGHATAARALGRLYDPAYLKQAALGGIDPDPAMARYWYEQAIAMGDAEAGPLLEAMSLR
jgi:hypothetical protein